MGIFFCVQSVNVAQKYSTNPPVQVAYVGPNATPVPILDAAFKYVDGELAAIYKALQTGKNVKKVLGGNVKV